MMHDHVPHTTEFAMSEFATSCRSGHAMNFLDLDIQIECSNGFL